jgi:heme oxygenase (biliverdin-IX-beta and delta-forming)
MTAEPEHNPAVSARRIVRKVARAALGTLLRDAGGAPYVSLVNVATDHDGAPLLLLSDLADHTRNLALDPRASLLCDDSGEREDPLAGERVTLQGRLARSDDPRHRRRYLARHPVAAMYADFKDFNFYRLAVERAHLVAGFGRIHWLAASALLAPPAPALIAREADIVLHMNDDHRDAIDACAQGLLGLTGDGWRLTGVDPEGCDLRRGHQVARLTFAQPVIDAESARAELVRLVGSARSHLAAAS